MTAKLRHYIRLYETTMTLLVLIVALLLPRVSAVLVEFLPGVDTVILCTGSDYVTVTLDAEGNPTEVSDAQGSDCLRSLAAEVSLDPSSFWQKLTRDFDVVFARLEHPSPGLDVLHFLKAPRAPPVVI
jgi:hypothetical protein